MLTCRQVTEKSSAMLDGGLPVRERLAMRMHLLMCVHCRRFQRHLQMLVAGLAKDEPSVPVDQAFIDSVLDHLEGNSKDPSGPHGP